MMLLGGTRYTVHKHALFAFPPITILEDLLRDAYGLQEVMQGVEPCVREETLSHIGVYGTCSVWGAHYIFSMFSPNPHQPWKPRWTGGCGGGGGGELVHSFARQKCSAFYSSIGIGYMQAPKIPDNKFWQASKQATKKKKKKKLPEYVLLYPNCLPKFSPCPPPPPPSRTSTLHFLYFPRSAVLKVVLFVIIYF